MGSSSARLHAYLSYRDPQAGLRWLERVGFELLLRQDGPDGGLAHAEVRYGDAVLMVAGAAAAYDVPRLRGVSTGGGLYLWMPDAAAVDRWHERALAAGGREVIAPECTPWGTRRCRVLDVEGHEWSCGTYAPGGTHGEQSPG